MPDTTTPGASPGEWSHFDLILGLREDLLPAVCNPQAPISPKSSLKKLGKTPSQYNSKRFATGFVDWTQHKTNQNEIDKWSKEPEYGICLQTRKVRAIDVDVPDAELAQVIEQFIETHLSTKLPKRMRSNSGKFLLAFTLEGDLAHREVPVEGGVIEFLGSGQQFIAVGMHESGVPYEWASGLPIEIPVLGLQEFEDLWQMLVATFATGEDSIGSGVQRKQGPTIEMDDTTADYLHQNNLVLGVGRGDSLLIKCPFGDEHSSGNDGDGSTVYFPAGTNGYQQGHFKCLHAHCKAKKDEEFVEALGVITAAFEVLTPAAPPKPWPNFRRDKQGRIYSTLRNLEMAVERSDVAAMELGFDEFKDEIVRAQTNTQDWVSFKDSDYVELRLHLEKIGFMTIGRELIRDVVLMIAERNRFDSAKLWLNSLVWDGIPRVTNFLRDYMGADDTEYVRGVSNYLWSALAGRVLNPGIKADMVPILVGNQGAGKSSGVSAMVPDMQFFTEISFSEKDDNLARMMRGRLLAEIGELRGLNTKDLESIKAFVTRQQENWVPKYREFAISYPRRTVFIGTTNNNEFLSDETGNRRFLPVKTPYVDVYEIRSDCLQLWAEAASMFAMLGIQWRGMEQLALETHREHMVVDPWLDQVRRWLHEPSYLTGIKPVEQDYVTADEVLRGAIGFETKQITKREEMRVSRTLGALRFTKERRTVNNHRIYVYFPEIPQLAQPALAEVGHG